MFRNSNQMKRFQLNCRIAPTQFQGTTHINMEQAGTGPSRRHIQGSKIAKDFQVSSILFYSTRKSKIFRKNYILKKMDRLAR